MAGLLRPAQGHVAVGDDIRLFTDDPQFIQSAQITLIYVLVGTPITLAAALGVAMLLNRDIPFKGLITTLLLLPMMLSMAVVGHGPDHDHH